MNTKNRIFYWSARIIAAAIMLQTLFFKFSGSAESVEIFSRVGMEPWGRIVVGVMELMASVLILVNVTAWIGAGVALGLMVGAIGMHLTILGIEVRDDGGQLFIYALAVALCSTFILARNRDKILSLVKTFSGRSI